MTLLILGILMALVGYFLGKTNEQLAQAKNIIIIAGIALAVVGTINSCFKTIEPGVVGVPTLFGKVDHTILESGLNVINPLVKVEEFDVKTQNYTMSGVANEGDQQGDDAIRVLSADGLEVVIDVTVLYRVISSEAPTILQKIGTDYRNTVVRPITRTKIRDNAVYYLAVDLYSDKRDEFQNKVFKSIEENFKERGLFLEQLLVRNIALPASVKSAIESKINAEQESQKMQFVLGKEKQEAERKRVEAQGIADYQKILNTGLSDKLLQYEQIKVQRELATSPNSKIIVLGGGKGVPLILNGN